MEPCLHYNIYGKRNVYQQFLPKLIIDDIFLKINTEPKFCVYKYSKRRESPFKACTQMFVIYR